jgi:ketosteroid isomerase-like protein
MTFDATRKDGSEYKLEELSVYEVNDGKIISEQFFYSM